MEDLSIVLKEYYETIGIIPRNTRELDQVYARLHQIGRIFGKNHATIHHAVKNHEQNHNWSEMYRYYHSIANDILLECPIKSIQSDNKLQAQFTRQKMRIVELEYEVEKLTHKCQELSENCSILQKLNKQLQNAD